MGGAAARLLAPAPAPTDVGLRTARVGASASGGMTRSDSVTEAAPTSSGWSISSPARSGASSRASGAGCAVAVGSEPIWRAQPSTLLIRFSSWPRRRSAAIRSGPPTGFSILERRFSTLLYNQIAMMMKRRPSKSNGPPPQVVRTGISVGSPKVELGE